MLFAQPMPVVSPAAIDLRAVTIVRHDPPFLVLVSRVEILAHFTTTTVVVVAGVATVTRIVGW
jgi:hypothetical protein